MRTPLLTNPKKWPISRRRSMTAGFMAYCEEKPAVIDRRYSGKANVSDNCNFGRMPPWYPGPFR